MAKYSHRNNPENQPELISEPRAEYTVTPQQQAEKEAYRERLRLHLKDPAFRQIEGFPIGEDEAILALSDPPYYTACPNPFLSEIIARWQQERTALRQELDLPVESHLPIAGERIGGMAEPYHREPFAADVSEGKNDPIYNAYSYHTKVPHKAIMRYILHYTDPGDIVLDGFCGTGMTGVAAQLCGHKKTIESLGYHVDKKGVIYDVAPDQGGKPISRSGARRAVLVDLSPAAALISHNYNAPVNVKDFGREARRILAEVEQECGWMYETWHPNCDNPGRVKGKINYTIWSDVFVCPQCGGEIVFWDVAVDQKNSQINSTWNCPHCQAHLSKSPQKDSGAQRAERAFETKYDRALGNNIRQARQVPVLINYSVGKKRYQKSPDNDDRSMLAKIEDSDIPYIFPTQRILKGDKTSDPFNVGITHTHHFYTRRNLWVLAAIRHKTYKSSHYALWQGILRGSTSYSTKMVKVNVPRLLSRGGLFAFGAVTGTLYIPSLNGERPILDAISGKIAGVIKILLDPMDDNTIITNCSSSFIPLENGSVDYIFIDPPFGSNLMYSELNFLWEAWLDVFTNNCSEAIVNRSQHKGLPEYQNLMEACFQQFYHILKPGHWMTIEFHNTENAVWNSIQEGLLRAGFVVADVRTLNKTKGSFNQVTSSSAVKDDLIISAYKPDTAFEHRFISEGGSIQGAWDFIRQHLEQLPTPALEEGVMETLAERQGYLLYDRMVAFHIQRGLSVPLSAPEFYAGLSQRFLDRDGMYFTPAQAAEYDKRRLGAQKVEQLALFVSDEKSALLWLRRELDPEIGSGSQTYQDLQPKFIRELHQARHEALPELRTILEQNFLQDEAQRWYQPNPERQADLDALRQKALLREFSDYLSGKGRLRVFRSEAVRAGFSHAWKERDYNTILKVAERLPEAVLQEDQNLLMYVHNAALRQQEKPSQMPLI